MDTPARPRANKLLILLVVALVVALVVVDMRRRAAENRSLTFDQMASGQANEEAARRIVARVRELYDIPAGVEPTVAAIVDVSELRKRNAFYNKAENGDYLIVTTDRAIIYDPQNDIILDVAPVQIQQQAAPAQNTSSSAKPSAPAAAKSSSSVVSSARSSAQSSVR